MSRYAVVGNPVAHSKSPLIHTLFAEQTGIALQYTTIESPLDGFAATVLQFFSDGGKGLNVTVPFKEEAFALVTHRSDRAGLARAVNTLFVDDDGALCGDNTDGAGLVADIVRNHGFQLKGKRVLLLGAGGAVRGALSALIHCDLQEITVANRTRARAETLRDEFRELARIAVADYAELGDETFDLVINGTSLGLEGRMPPITPDLLAADCCCYDMMYGDEDTTFQRWARESGATLALDGLGMLVEQAAESFAIWHGVRPETAPILKALRSQ